MSTITETLINAGGKEWIKGEMHRIYFNDTSILFALAGYKISYYGTGNIRSACDADGNGISNTKAYKLSSQLHKEFFDVKTGKFATTNAVTTSIVEKLSAKTTVKKDKKAVMTRAWVIAKEAQAKFGGKASQYLSGALKAAWAE